MAIQASIFFLLSLLLTLVTAGSFMECSCESSLVENKKHNPLPSLMRRTVQGTLEDSFSELEGAISIKDHLCSAHKTCNTSGIPPTNDFESRCLLYRMTYHVNPQMMEGSHDGVVEYRNCALVKTSVMATECHETTTEDGVKYTACFCDGGDMCNTEVLTTTMPPTTTTTTHATLEYQADQELGGKSQNGAQVGGTTRMVLANGFMILSTFLICLF